MPNLITRNNAPVVPTINPANNPDRGTTIKTPKTMLNKTHGTLGYLIIRNSIAEGHRTPIGNSATKDLCPPIINFFSANHCTPSKFITIPLPAFALNFAPTNLRHILYPRMPSIQTP